MEDDVNLAPISTRVPTRHEKLVEQTRKWVALTFFEPMLEDARKGPFHSDMLDGGRGGQAFAGLYDQQLAQHMTRGAGHKLVDAIVHRIEQTAAARGQDRFVKSESTDVEHEGADRAPQAQRRANVATAF